MTFIIGTMFPLSNSLIMRHVYVCSVLYSCSIYVCIRPPYSCTDGLGRSCLAIVLLAMFLDSDLPPMVAMEIVQRYRGPAAIQTIKVSIISILLAI